MKVFVNCGGMKLEIPCGSGKQHMRWLALVAATRMQREKYPHAFRVPQGVRSSDGQQTYFKPRQVICDTLQDGDEVIVDLRQGASIAEDEDDAGEWIEEAYGVNSNLMECKFRWKGDSRSTASEGYPKMVRGEYFVDRRWEGVYPQSIYGGEFEIPIDINDTGDPDNPYEWVASRKGPPGTCRFLFLMDTGQVEVCKAMPESLTRDGTKHEHVFGWDVPVAPEPFPEIDSRPSTASSRDGAQVDPRFEQDWEAMKLAWVESYMKVRVKDVLTEFYAIMIDLFDSYAFMGLDLSASQHTIGMDDWKHLILSCGLLDGQPSEGNLPWGEVCSWFEAASGIRDGRPYLSQRLTRTHYLELLMRTAGWCMCKNPREKYKPDPGRPPMPLDEGLFRFITDILIPVMDVYDDDPIRKDAVQSQNLLVIQQKRTSIRSIYSFLSQPSASCDNEKVVIPSTFKFLFEFPLSQLNGVTEGATAAAAGEEKSEGEVKASTVDFVAVLGGEDRLSGQDLQFILDHFDRVVLKVTEHHPEPPESRALLFWEFFEALMHLSRELRDSMGTPLHEALPKIVATATAVMGLIDQGGAVLPEPPEAEDEFTEEMEG
mmetsp:Transcript_118524/g.335274  ORF Transcript_118524/g.335274 Transcript_118524/m.335274 type:complete len:600 (+) Transcript_118524:185-1984(+)|eukprot:CAMPEP_0117472732 /NCGR_PEP_ID=MMETSP0784-20121206/8403_1 /TAXON_ID=39447 /ORGANISM="" /LENGTH=599 /DNA_ID=CAMNT_0005266901 /DNA_START=180 /DNA_END=1979 /DNA_ORIENTATION=-